MNFLNQHTHTQISNIDGINLLQLEPVKNGKPFSGKDLEDITLWGRAVDRQDHQPHKAGAEQSIRNRKCWPGGTCVVPNVSWPGPCYYTHLQSLTSCLTFFWMVWRRSWDKLGSNQTPTLVGSGWTCWICVFSLPAWCFLCSHTHTHRLTELFAFQPVKDDPHFHHFLLSQSEKVRGNNTVHFTSLPIYYALKKYSHPFKLSSSGEIWMKKTQRWSLFLNIFHNKNPKTIVYIGIQPLIPSTHEFVILPILILGVTQTFSLTLATLPLFRTLTKTSFTRYL